MDEKTEKNYLTEIKALGASSSRAFIWYKKQQKIIGLIMYYIFLQAKSEKYSN